MIPIIEQFYLLLNLGTIKQPSAQSLNTVEQEQEHLHCRLAIKNFFFDAYFLFSLCSDDQQFYMIAYSSVLFTDLPPLKDYSRSQVGRFKYIQ